MEAAIDWRSAPVPVIAGLGDTRKNGGGPYQVRPLGEILSGLKPQQMPKERAFAFLPSLYAANDARSHSAQRERGKFVALVGDIDHGDYPLPQVVEAIERLSFGTAWSIYSTASARPDDRRWRVIVPLAEPASFDDWHDAQLALVDFMRGAGIDLDTCAARPGQVAFLPNVPAEARDLDGEPLFFEQAASPDAPGLSIGTGSIAGGMTAIRAQRFRDDQERQRIRAEAEQRRARRPISSGDGGSMIETFNRSNILTALLDLYGYEQSPRDSQDWRSPQQTSGSYATRVIDGGKWISLSGSDAAARIGDQCASGCYGDAFDLFVFYEHGGDRTSALRQLHRERETTEQHGSFDPDTGEVLESAETAAEANDGEEGALPLPTLDLVALAGVEPRNKAFAIERLAPLGEVTLFTGAGSAGKSLLGQQIATCAAGGVPVLGLTVMQTPAVYLTCEDDAEQLHWRQSKICQALNLKLVDLAGSLHLSSLRGVLDSELAHFDNDGALKPTKAFFRLVQMIKLTGAKIAILDNVAHLFTGNENDRGEVTRFVNLLNRLAGSTGAAILLIGHPNKSGDSYSGSTAWLNAVRSQVFLAHDLDTDIRTLTVGKANYAQKGDALRFLWFDGAFVREEELPEDFAAELAQTIKVQRENEAFLACLRARMETPGREVGPNLGPNYAPRRFAEMTEAKGLTKQALARAMERLIYTGAIRTEQMKRKGSDSKTIIVEASPNAAEASE